MLLVGECIVSEDVKTTSFCCDLSKCKGCCCVEGDAGAPLLKEELPVIEKLLPQIKPYMNQEGIEAIKDGFWEKDTDGDLCTKIIEGRDCAFVVYENDIALCAIERAYRDGKIDFQKPISCHLYPIRVKDYGEFQALNYHRWDICKDALKNEKAEPLYKVLKEPLIRRFSEKWYEELVWVIENQDNQ
ncbi:MAG: DUF3109 family protein [Bacteroidales bacterium]|jgi:hypothetical protein|nr:DUF3109 family protein [Bacteroidales bacterium]